MSQGAIVFLSEKCLGKGKWSETFFYCPNAVANTGDICRDDPPIQTCSVPLVVCCTCTIDCPDHC